MKKDESNLKLFTNGCFYLNDTEYYGSFLVENGVIKEIYDTGEEIECNDDTDRVDMQGAYIYPGFIDSHVHVFEAGYCMDSIPLEGCVGAKKIAEKITEYIEEHNPTQPLLIGTGFGMEFYAQWGLDDLEILDNATGDYLFMGIDHLGHNMVINTRSINYIAENTQVDLNTADNPMGGVIVKEGQRATGMLMESAMTFAGTPLFATVDDSIIYKGAMINFRKWANMGYTSIVDLMGGPFGRMLKPDICFEMEKNGELPLRINYMYTFFKLDEINGALEYVDKNTDRVQFGGLKLFVDGAYAAGQAWTTWPHKDEDSKYGISYVTTENIIIDEEGNEHDVSQYNIHNIVAKVNELGLDIHYHAQGDEAVEVVLDALERITQYQELNSTHTFIHLAFPTSTQMDRMKKFNGRVVATVQPAFWKAEEGTAIYYGQEQADSAYPIKDLMDKGISTGLSTDYWVSPFEDCPPTAVMNIAMTGGTKEKHPHPPLSIREIIKGFTKGSAATTKLPCVGEFGVGYKADMVVYDKDLCKLNPDEFDENNPRVMSTWIGGMLTTCSNETND
jgi:predicted amidohydrolase YtcJ